MDTERSVGEETDGVFCVRYPPEESHDRNWTAHGTSLHLVSPKFACETRRNGVQTVEGVVEPFNGA